MKRRKFDDPSVTCGSSLFAFRFLADYITIAGVILCFVFFKYLILSVFAYFIIHNGNNLNVLNDFFMS